MAALFLKCITQYRRKFMGKAIKDKEAKEEVVETVETVEAVERLINELQSDAD